jgi:hypothetical protein
MPARAKKSVATPASNKDKSAASAAPTAGPTASRKGGGTRACKPSKKAQDMSNYLRFSKLDIRLHPV